MSIGVHATSIASHLLVHTATPGPCLDSTLACAVAELCPGRSAWLCTACRERLGGIWGSRFLWRQSRSIFGVTVLSADVLVSFVQVAQCNRPAFIRFQACVDESLSKISAYHETVQLDLASADV